MEKDYIKLMLFHLLNCINCGELCLFLFFFVESEERTVCLLYAQRYLFLFLTVLFPCLWQQIFGKCVSQDITVWPCLAHRVVQHEVIHVLQGNTLKKKIKFKKKIENGYLKYTVKAGSRHLLGMRWILVSGKPLASWLVEAWVWRLPHLL